MITFKHISKIYKIKKRHVIALNDVSLTLPDSGFVLLEGSSGSGKSTFIKLLSLQLKPSQGKLFINDEDTTTFKDKDVLNFRKHVFGIVDQDFNLINTYTVKDNLAIAIEIQGSKFDLDNAIKILKEVGLDESFLERKVCELSGGEQQRIAIARALIKHSKIIVCDEPTGNLDENNATQIANLLKDISKSRLVVVASHDKRLMESYADRIIFIKNGNITQDNTINDAFDKLTVNDDSASTYRFPLIRSIKIAFSFLKSGVGKLIFLMISTFLTVGVAMTSSSILSYDEIDLKNRCVINSGANYYGVGKKTVDFDVQLLNDDDLNAIGDVFGDENVIPLGNDEALHTVAEDGNPNKPSISYGLPFSEKYMTWINYPLFGTTPKDSLFYNTYEVILTVHLCAQLGWIEDEYNFSSEELQNIIDNKTLNVTLGYMTIQRKIDLKIVGIYDTNYPILGSKNENRLDHKQMTYYIDTYEMHNDIFFYQTDFIELCSYDAFGQKMDVEYCGVLVKHTNDFNTKLAKMGDEYVSYHRVDPSIRNMKEFENSLGVLLEYISLVFLGITIISFIALIKTIMDKSANEIRILQLLGLSKTELFLVNSIQTVFISLICFLTAMIPYLICIYNLNIYLMSDLMLVVAPLNYFNWQLFVIILLPLILLSLIISLFATLSATKINVKNANNIAR